MTIIERALNKHRPVAQAAALASGKELRKPAAPALDPANRVQRTAVPIDLALCRERRILVTSETNEDRAYVAAYRMLRTRLLHRVRTANWTTVAVTSAGPSDGKTLTTINLALSLAREKTREIVLLDLDMRNPSVCRALNVRPPQELSAYLEHGGDPNTLFMTIGSDNLLIAGCITPTENASELLSGSGFQELIDFIKKSTVDPLVLIDLPPVLVTDDALVLAPKIDSLLVIASEGHTKRSDLDSALALLSEFPIAGVVLNRAGEGSTDYNYGYGYTAESESGTDRKKT
jgi:Mrp family chromosome partitioning ATPase